MGTKQTCIVIGGSHAGGQLVARLRPEGWEGNIRLISKEAILPYHRPPLSKAFLAGEKQEDQLLIRAAEFYTQNNIEFIPNREVLSIDRDRKEVTLDNEEVLSYDKLALCCGASVRRLNIPGSDLANVFYLRDLQDSARIKEAIGKAETAVVIGGGYIGLEVAASLTKLQLEVTLLEAQSRILERTSCAETARYIHQKHLEKGVQVITDELATSFKGEDRVEAVIGRSGKEYPADLVVIGIGILPNIQLAEAAGLEVGDGILVDEFARTSDPDIVAAGDCTCHPNSLLGYRLRLESVPNATDQANAAAASICGQQKEHRSLPWFWSDQFDMKLQIAGLCRGYDQVVVREEGKSFVAWYLREGCLIAADCINYPVAFMVAKQVIAKGLPVDAKDLGDLGVEVKALLRRG